MNNLAGKKEKTRYLSEFPIIILVAIVAIVIMLIVMYFNVKPYDTVYRNGYMILANNMTSNLINKKSTENFEELDVGVVNVKNGDYIYKQADAYFVGVEKKEKIDFDYPLYSRDGLTIYNINENVILIDRNFDRAKGYKGISLNHGIVYNDGDLEPTDDIDYLYLYLNNSIYVNAQTMVVQTLMNEYTIPLHSTLYFDTEYLNFYVFDGKKFRYNSITDINFDSIVKIGDIELTYYEMLLNLELIEKEELEDEENKEDIKNEEEIIEKPKEELKDEENNNIEEPEWVYIKPTVSVSDFSASVYYIYSELSVNDPASVITSNPSFELHTLDGNLYSRKKFGSSGEIAISGLSSDTEYKIVGTYKYKNEYGVELVSKFYEGKVKTKDISFLDSISITSTTGDRYSNKIEIKDLQILNHDVETITGIKKVVLSVTEEGTSETKNINLGYSKISNLKKGDKVTISSQSNLKSNTVYDYFISFFDKDGNELKCEGICSGTIKTTKKAPDVKISSTINSENNKVDINIETINPDNIYIKEYRYTLYSYTGLLISEDELDYNDKADIDLHFDNLDYETNYIIQITGLYDLEDGKGERELLIEKDFTTANLKKSFTAWYETNTLQVTTNSITAEVKINSNTIVLEKPSTELIVYLTDEKGNDILDENDDLKYYKKYTKEEYINELYSGYYVNPTFDDLESGKTYNIKVKIIVHQLENVVTLEKELTPSITTLFEEAFVKVLNKKLIGDNLNISLEFVDPDNLIDDHIVAIEFYKGNYSDVKEIKERYIYRTTTNISQSGSMTFNFYGYIEENYTVVVSTENYKGKKHTKYLSVNNPESDLNVINVDRNLSAKLEMFEQKNSNNNKLDTKISFEYNFYDTVTDIYFVDCVGEKCTNLGYFNEKNEFIKNHDNYNEVFNNPDNTNRKIVSFKNDKIEQDHTFYLLVEKAGTNIKGKTEFTMDYYALKYNFYALKSLEYNTKNEIYRINEASDFFGSTEDNYIINTDKDFKHYVVTKNIDFYNNLYETHRFTNFNGIIDFQGYSVDLYNFVENEIVQTENGPKDISHHYKFNLFSSIGTNGVMKNAVFNYNLDYTGIMSSLPGFVYTNNGTMENIIITVNQSHLDQNITASNIGLLAYENKGLIDNFVVYLKSNIHTYGETGLVTYENHGTISNGYVMSDPTKVDEMKIISTESSNYHGTIARRNRATIENVYNLVSIEGSNSGTATMAQENNGTVKNTISVATTTQTNSKAGPTIYKNNGKASNNYYVDTNPNNTTYSSTSSKKVSVATLMNKSIWDVTLNSDNAFDIVNGYYPILKMNDFMGDKQTMIAIPYDYFNEKRIDVLSAEAIQNNLDGQAQAIVKISNPLKNEITGVLIDHLTTSIASVEYDEESQISIVTLNLDINNGDKAQSTYYIRELQYLDDLGGNQKLIYTGQNENSRRLDIDMYMHVYNYSDFITHFDNNQNILLKSDLKIDDNLIPASGRTYSAILDGRGCLDSNGLTRECIIDLDNKNITRGYYIYSVTGTLNNFQIKNINIETEGDYVGIIRTTSSANISNIDLANYLIKIKRDYATMYLGGLVAYTTNSTIQKVSVNDIEIVMDISDSLVNNIKNINVGGLVGYAYNVDNINNCYVYNIKVDNIRGSTDGEKSLGGIVGNLRYGTVEKCYSTGTMRSKFIGVGGIVGRINESTVRNNYSYMYIIAESDDTGGIVGNRVNGTGTIDYNMFIGHIVDNYNKEKPAIYSVAANSPATNYALTNLSSSEKSRIIDSFETLSSYVQVGFADFEGTDLPYLIESSFVEQKIKGQAFSELSLDSSMFNIIYHSNSDAIKTEIENVNNSNEKILTSNLDLYNNSNADYVELTLNDPKYMLDYTFVNNETITDNGELRIEKIDEKVYHVYPKKYFNSYNLRVTNGNASANIQADMKFYRKITDQESWKKIEKEENIILVNDIIIDSNTLTNEAINKRINVFLGNGYTINFDKDTSLKNNLIEKIIGNMRDVTFSNISITSSTAETGLIKVNEGNVENCAFENIDISNSGNKTALFSISYGKMNNIKLNNINVYGRDYTASLVSYNNSGLSDKRITNVVADNINIDGRDYVGGIVGYTDYSISDVNANDVIINNHDGNPYYPRNYIGGIMGQGDCVNNCSISNSEIYASSNYIGGVGGYEKNINKSSSNINISNLLITNKPSGYNATKISYVGGAYGYRRYISTVNVDNLYIANRTGDGKINEYSYSNINANNVGGVVGSSSTLSNSKVNNSKILGYDKVGGFIGLTQPYFNSVERNLTLNTFVSASNMYAGGIIGGYQSTTSGTPKIQNCLVQNSTVVSNSYSGGIVSYIMNTNNKTQNLIFNNNMVINSSISVNNLNGVNGALIGYLDRVPGTSLKKITNSLFYNNSNNEDMSLVGYIKYKETGAESGYGKEELSEFDFATKSNFKEYVIEINNVNQINTLEQLKQIVPESTVYNYMSENHFPIFDNNYPEVDVADRVELPNTNNVRAPLMMMRAFSRTRMLANSYNNTLDIDYDVYTSGVNIVNFEFSSTDPNTYFYYEIGDYTSNYISLNDRTYTITYDFKNPIKLYLSNGYNYKESVYMPSDLVKTISVVNGKTYYIQDGILYGDSKSVTGKFLNLFDDEVLTESGKIYNIKNKKESDSYITYNALEKSKPLYEFIYNGNNINTYYNYSIVNNTIKEMQLFVKNGNLNSISSTVENKKNMYIIDYYNNNEIQIILKNDGKLYSLKHNIKYPNDIVNEQIAELYTDIKSNNSIVVLKYTNGAVYSFDYISGDVLFTNVSQEYSSFWDYAKSKLNNSNKNNVISNVLDSEKHEEFEKIKTKLIDIPLDEAKDKIYNSNNFTGTKDKYIGVYNELTKNYDVYKISTLMNDSLEIESETQKIYKDYQLNKFYKNLAKGNTKNSVSGIILFVISIISVFITLGLLIKHKINKKSGVL